ncbi:MAG: xylan 1,4-beta-xylosidase, partial [Vallitaleaceae bacterium]|nr:xylan 1,4-beta-xylosidase [Vallitaleaceae bacterium]
MTTKIRIHKESKIPFENKATYCIGTGRMGLALQKEYYEQLSKVQEEIGFSYIRGHGLFCDDMAIYQSYEENGEIKVEYNFTYLDRVIDAYIGLGIKPFLELGFMPNQLASGEQTVFYWKGNVTPPRDYEKWAALIQATLQHCIKRYGREEVLNWPVEVWNEPNLPGFWKGADMEEYFRLYDASARAVKACDPKIRVGGPAICGVDDIRWLTLFLEHCAKNDSPLDFVTRHAYATEMPTREGRYDYQKLRSPKVFLDELKESRRIIDSFPKYSGMEMHITEFNTSYTPQNPIHDTNLNAAYIARLLSEMGDLCASYSYWTFGDVFEETGVAFTPFSGGFGLLANGAIPKPTYWTFAFFKALGSNAVYRDEHCIITKDELGNLRGIAWNVVDQMEDEKLSLGITFETSSGDYVLLTREVSESCCNPLQNWM